MAVPAADIGYIRFHGRNQENWWLGDNASRYNYLYSDDELNEWQERIATLSATAHTVFIYFNNHWQAQAVRNAEQMRKMIDNG